MSSFAQLQPLVLHADLGCASSTGSYMIRPPVGFGPWTLQSAYFDACTSIATSSTAYYTIDLHQVTAAGGTHSTTASTTFSFETDAHTAYVADAITLSGTKTSLVCETLEAIEVLLTKTGSPANLPIGAKVVTTWLHGTGVAQ